MRKIDTKSFAEKITSIYLAFFSAFFMVLGLYMLETIEWHRSWGFSQYVLPFGFLVEWYIARDVGYVMIVAGYIFLLFLKLRGE